MLVSKAIKVAIRHHFGGARGFEQEIYTRLMDINADNCDKGFSDINPDIYVWPPFKDYPIETILMSVDRLIDDIIAETIGE